MAQFVFKPYSEALARREERTRGYEGKAHEYLEKSVRLHETYETKARLINGQIRQIFDDARKTASTEVETLIARARTETAKLIEQTRGSVSKELVAARAQLREETPKVAGEIAKKLLSDNQRATQ